MIKEVNPSEAENYVNPVYCEREIDLLELFSIIWRDKWKIILVTSVFAFTAVIYAISLPNSYKAEALLAPAEGSQSEGGLAALAGQLGGVANIAGINLSGGGDDRTTLAIEIMLSRKFIINFIRDNNILPELMAAKGWDKASNRVLFDEERYNSDKKEWLNLENSSGSSKPSYQKAYKEFLEKFSVKRDKDTGFIKVSIEHYSPSLAKEWIDLIIKNINGEMKYRDVGEAKRGQEFLEKQLQNTNVADMRTVLYQLMEQAQKTIMFANIREEYVFKTIDPAIVPEEKSNPKRALICILITMIGFLLVSIVIILKALFGKHTKKHYRLP